MYNFCNKHNCFVIVILCLVSTFSTSCKKFVEIPAPKNQITTPSVFSNNSSAEASQIVIYSLMAGGSTLNIPWFTGLSGDEFVNYSTNIAISEFYGNGLQSGNGSVNSAWAQSYRYIYLANAVLEGLQNSSGVTNAMKTELTGEAKFVRAFWHFYLVNLFGDVPLITSTDYRINSVASRIPKAQVYQQIVVDLNDAQNLLPNNYSYSSGERTRPNKWAAMALLARAYLFLGDWLNAESVSTQIINNSSTFSLVPNVNNVFLANSRETIWQLRPVNPNQNTVEGSTFILTTTPSSVSLNARLVNAFEIGDSRRLRWIDSIIVGGNTYYYPKKYKVKSGTTITEYSMVLRLAEQYLIRAEARVQQNKIPEAQSDLNSIRNRAGLSNTAANTQGMLLSAILNERQVELFTEWGHRWLDLKRTNTIDAVMNVVAPLKGGIWNTYKQHYPIPQIEIQNDGNLTQNPGY